MTRKLLWIVCLLVTLTGLAQAQNPGPWRYSVVRKAIFFFPKDQCSYIERSEYPKIMPFIEWAKANPKIDIQIHGWTDKSSTETQNSKLSQTRANITRDFLVKQGIPADRIVEVEGRGAHQNSKSDFAARRVELLGVEKIESKEEYLFELEITENPEPSVKPAPKPVQKSTPTTEPMVEVVEDVPVIKEIREPEPAKATSEPKREAATQATPAKQLSQSSVTLNTRWYAGLEGGVALGLSTFSSFAEGSVGWSAGALAGYQITDLLSVELGLSAGGLRMGATECCERYLLGADGERYLTRVAGMETYKYSDIYSSVSTQTVALRLNIDLLQIANPDWRKRWGLSVSPALYGMAATATIKERATDNTIIKRNTLFQFGAGIGLGGSFRITNNLSIGLRSSAFWLFGNQRYDGLPTADHCENIIWNNTATLTWRFIYETHKR